MLGKDLTKQDHIVIVGWPGNSLDINCNHYSIEMDLTFTSQRTGNTNVGFVNLFSRHSKSWMNREMSVNVQLDQAVLGHSMYHNCVIDTTTIMGQEYMTHDLHLNL